MRASSVRTPSKITKLSWKAPDVYLRSGGLDHVTAMTANHNGHMIRIPSLASQHLNTLKESGTGGGERLLHKINK